MIAAVVQKSVWSLDKLTLGWFDVALILFVAFGFWRGRKRGMSKEVIPLLKWICIIAGCSLGYQLLGDELVSTHYIRKIFGNSVLERTAANITAYLAIALVIWSVFAILGNLFQKKIEGSQAFGGGEYYLGIVSGITRWLCVLIFLLAMLNAPFYTSQEMAARAEYNKRWFGGGMYDGNFLPDLPTLQSSVFKKSITGPVIKEYLPALLIESFSGAKKPAKR